MLNKLPSLPRVKALKCAWKVLLVGSWLFSWHLRGDLFLSLQRDHLNSFIHCFLIIGRR